MNIVELAKIGFYFWLARRRLKFRSRAALEAWQARRIKRFLTSQLPRAPFYRRFADSALTQLPIVDKGVLLEHFTEMNSAGISLEEATSVALASEGSRDFSPVLRGITVGLSSGTQGSRGIFMASAHERNKWAGIMLARVLTRNMIVQLLLGKAPLKVAFFMRANSNLYTTLASSRIDLRFYDLLGGLDRHLQALQAQHPAILVAPSRILGKIARLVIEQRIRLDPVKVIAVAEVLEPDDRRCIEQAFGGVTHQLYQCTEGFLAYTCEQGVLHLNEEFIHVEPEWLDAEHTRFVPVITDFTRTTQYFIRYRLNDILRVRPTACACNNPSMALAAIEGRCDDILWLPCAQGMELRALYPDTIRHAISIAPNALPDYRIEQRAHAFHIAVSDDAQASYESVADALRQAARRQGLADPVCHFSSFLDTAEHVKRRRIVCTSRPSTLPASTLAAGEHV
jgi:putative adenylate-forming enzyme